MSITYFPFDAVMDSDGNYDRTYTSEQFALYFSKLFSMVFTVQTLLAYR